MHDPHTPKPFLSHLPPGIYDFARFTFSSLFSTFCRSKFWKYIGGVALLPKLYSFLCIDFVATPARTVSPNTLIDKSVFLKNLNIYPHFYLEFGTALRDASHIRIFHIFTNINHSWKKRKKNNRKLTGKKAQK